MHEQLIPLVRVPTRQLLITPLKLLALTLTGLVALQAATTARAQNLNNEPLFGSISLEAGFTATPFTAEVSPGGEDDSSGLGNECYGYIRFSQPDFVLSYQADQSPLGVFALSDLDITLAINDPAGNWHCNDDSNYLGGTNSGIQFSAPLSGDYQIWVGSFGMGAESIATMLAVTEVDETEWASIPVGLEDAVYAASFDLNGDILFGDDSSGFANDNECDDGRFQGPGMAFGTGGDHLFKDATDCRAEFEAGLISLAEPEEMNLGGNMDTSLVSTDTDIFAGNSAVTSPITMPDAGPFGEVMFALMQAFQAIPGDDANALPLPFGLGGDTAADYNRAEMIEITGIDFGDNSGTYTDDGECDDPRFEGPGAASFNVEDDELADAADCSSLYLEGLVTYVEPNSVEPEQITQVAEPSTSQPSARSRSTRAEPPTSAPPETYVIGTPRGDINGATLEDGSIYASGTVYGGPIVSDNRRLAPADLAPAITRTTSNDAIDFGDNSSVWANDNECDDPRFEGEGMAFTTNDEDRGKDASDCQTAFEAGTITLIRN